MQKTSFYDYDCHTLPGFEVREHRVLAGGDRMKRIALIGPSAVQHKGGIAQHTSCLADELQKQAEVRFFSWKQEYPEFLIKRDFRDTVSTVSIGTSETESIIDYMNPRSWLRLARAICRYSPDSIYITWNHPVHAPIFVFLSTYLKRYTNAELVYICHNVLPHESFVGSETLARWALRKADRLIVHSRSEEYRAREVIGATRITRIFLPVSKFFPPSKKAAVHNKKTTGKTILFFGNIRGYKGLEMCLHAFSLVVKKHPDACLKIVGEDWNGVGKSKGTVLELIESLQLKDSVHTDLRYIPNEEVSEVFGGVDLAVFPYCAASQSGTLALAYSYGVPVVGTRVGGLGDVVRDGVSGYLVDPDDPHAFAEAIIKFFENPISSASVERFASRFSWEQYLTAF